MTDRTKRFADLNELNREALRRSIVHELMTTEPDTQTESIEHADVESDASPEIRAMIRRARRRHDDAQRCPLRGCTHSRNPLQAVLTGGAESVMVEIELNGESIPANLSAPRVSTRTTEYSDAPALDADHSLAASAALAANLAEADLDEVANQLDQNRPSIGDDIGVGELRHLRLDVKSWPDDARLLDVNVCRTAGGDPQAVLTVRRVDGGFELTADTGELPVMADPSMMVDLRVSLDQERGEK